jgi:methionine-rich copper-binding protein CopC
LRDAGLAAGTAATARTATAAAAATTAATAATAVTHVLLRRSCPDCNAFAGRSPVAERLAFQVGVSDPCT